MPRLSLPTVFAMIIGLAPVTGSAGEADPVTLQVERPAWHGGEEIAAHLETVGETHLFVPACNPLGVEFFDPRTSLWVSEPHAPCLTTQPAIPLATYREQNPVLRIVAQVDRFTLARLALVYGVDCREGFPLELADCQQFGVAHSQNLSLNPARED